MLRLSERRWSGEIARGEVVLQKCYAFSGLPDPGKRVDVIPYGAASENGRVEE